jgi:hypothetical protein
MRTLLSWIGWKSSTIAPNEVVKWFEIHLPYSRLDMLCRVFMNQEKLLKRLEFPVEPRDFQTQHWKRSICIPPSDEATFTYRPWFACCKYLNKALRIYQATKGPLYLIPMYIDIKNFKITDPAKLKNSVIRTDSRLLQVSYQPEAFPHQSYNNKTLWYFKSYLSYDRS